MDAFDGNTYRKAVLKPLLDGGSGSEDRLDPFTVLAIPPDEDDQAAIERRIGEVVAFWRREQNSARYRDLVHRLLDEREALQAQVVDPERRAAARGAAQEAHQQAEEERLARIDRMVERLVRSHPGGVPRSRIDRLRAIGSRDGVDEAALAARLDGVTVVEDSVEPLPAGERARLRSTLTAYNQLARTGGAGGRPARSLFDVLDVDPGAPDDAVRVRLDALAARNRQRRHDRLRTITDELHALATTHLVGPGRARYEATVMAEAREHLAPEIEATLLAEDRVSAAEYEHLVREAVAMGLSASAARAAVIAVAADLGGAVETGPALDYVRCPACGTVEAGGPAGSGAPGATRACRRCGTALYRSCPTCRHEIEAAAPRCPHCGTDLAALAEAERERHERFEAAMQLDGVERERALGDLLADHPGFERARRLLAETPPAPPGEVSATVGRDSVDVLWEPSASPGVDSYRLTRYQGDGRGRLVGQTQELGMEDAGVRKGGPSGRGSGESDTVRYEVVAVREGRSSAPATIELVVRDPDVVVLAVESDAREVRLSWAELPHGTVRIVRATTPPPAPGTRVGAAEREALGPMLPASAVDLVDGGPRWYVPLLIDGPTAVVGEAVAHPGVAPMSDVTATSEGDRVLVRWTWPPGCTEAQVRWHGPAGDGQAKVTNMKYQIDDGFRLPAPAPGAYRIAVVPGARVGRDLLWGPEGERLAHDHH